MFCNYFDEWKKPIAVNGSGITPKRANLQFYKDNKIKNIGLTSPHSVTITGAVHAWCSMHEKFGRIDFNEVLNSAENFARKGFPVHEVEAIAWKENEKKLKKNFNSKRLFLNQNLSYSYGEVFKNIPLANTLRIISKNKIKGFYQSEITKDMVKTLNKLGGLHTEEDFYNQKTLFSKTITNSYRNLKIHQCPLNSPGLVVLMMMAMTEKLNICLLYTSPSPRDKRQSRMPSSA